MKNRKLAIIATISIIINVISLFPKIDFKNNTPINDKIAMYLLDGPNGNVTSTINNIEGNYILDETKTTCIGASGVTGKITMTNHKLNLNTNGSVKCNVYFYEEQASLVEKILAQHKEAGTLVNGARIGAFDTAFPGNVPNAETNRNLYKTTEARETEDYPANNPIYYYAGRNIDNWVVFGECTDSKWNCTVGDKLFWRIIRTNSELEGGGVRLLYAGSGPWSDGKSIPAVQNAYITSAYYSGDGSYMQGTLVGFMRGNNTGLAISGRTNQTVITNSPYYFLKQWYNNTFKTNYNNYINYKAIYCNDRSSYNIVRTVNNTYNYYFGTYGRLAISKNPSYRCGSDISTGLYTSSDDADKFSGDVSTGNGLLSESPVGLITSDEVAYAGGKYQSNSYAWYYCNSSSNCDSNSSSTGSTIWWTMSPFFSIPETNGGSAIGIVRNNGEISSYLTNSYYAVRPVLSLKSNVSWVKGDGTVSNPYQVKM